MTSMGDRCSDSQFYLRTDAVLAPDLQLSADTVGALTDPEWSRNSCDPPVALVMGGPISLGSPKEAGPPSC
jgi:hypothetical protein